MRSWDLAIVGAGPAGAATAIGALRAEPGLRVAMLDRSTFPRDKSCGDGIAPHVVDLLEGAGVDSVVHDQVPVSRLCLARGRLRVDRSMDRPTWVVPRAVFDHRLVTAAQAAGAVLVHERVRAIRRGPTLLLDDRHEAPIVVGADGAHSVVRRGLALRPGPMAVALRGYAPTPTPRAGAQLIVFDEACQPAYAWSFDRGDGLSNVGYGALLRSSALTRAQLLQRLEVLLPGATANARNWKAHHLPLSTGRFRPRAGPVLLAGDAAGLVNPMTGEGIYYAVATGLAAGFAAAEALASADPASAGSRYARKTRPLLARHLRHTSVAGLLCRNGAVIQAALRAAAAEQSVYDDLVELGLARGRITARTVRGLVRHLADGTVGPATTPSRHHEETPACES